MSIIWSFVALTLSSQVVVHQFPAPLQVFPRDANNFGHFTVSGVAPRGIMLKSELVKSANDSLYQSVIDTVNESGRFLFRHAIPAHLSEYDYGLYALLEDSVWYYVGEAKGLLAGDFFIVSGQSNAEGSLHDPKNAFSTAHSNPWIRSLGFNFSRITNRDSGLAYALNQSLDLEFRRSSTHPDFDAEFGFSGIWPLRLQYYLSLQSGIPNCVVNGSKGASAIAEHFPASIPSECFDPAKSARILDSVPPSLYGRIFHKLYFTGSVKGVKGIFWYQGETDGAFDEDSARNYTRRFEYLRRAWMADYPNLKQIFVFQLNLGCYDGNLPIIREEQRKFTQKFSNVTVMSTVGSAPGDRQDDLCHYSVAGCSRLADLMLHPALHKLYGKSIDPLRHLPPDIVSIVRDHPLSLRLQFSSPVIAQDSCNYALPHPGTVYLKDYFYDEENKKIPVNKISTEPGELILHLENNIHSEKLTYLPACYSTIPGLYAGPWILSAGNPILGAFSFYKFPIQDHSKTIVTHQLEEVRIDPNPSGNEIRIICPTEPDYSWQLFNLSGRMVLSGISQGKETQLAFPEITEGIYMLFIRSEKISVWKKIIIE